GTAAGDLGGNNLQPISGNNLIGDVSSALNLTNGTNGNLVGLNGSGIRPLNTIVNTTTFKLLANSPAFNAGSNSVVVPMVVPNAGFETPVLAANDFRYNPAGGSWTFSGASPSGSGISANNSGFTFANPAAPEGSQVAFL